MTGARPRIICAEFGQAPTWPALSTAPETPSRNTITRPTARAYSACLAWIARATAASPYPATMHANHAPNPTCLNRLKFV